MNTRRREVLQMSMKYHLFKCRYSNLLQAVLTVTFSAMMYYFSSEHWILTWLAPIPLCIYALEATLFSTIFAGFSAYIIGTLNPNAVLPMQVYYYVNIVNGIVFAILLSIFRYVTIRYKHWTTSLIFASGWTSYECITSYFSPNGTVASFAYTQTDNLAIIQIASVTGILGITFILLLIPASIAAAWYYHQNRTSCIKASLIPVSLLLVIVLFGAYRLNMPNEIPKIKIGITAITTTMEQYMSVVTNRDTQQVVNAIENYSKKIDILAQAGVEVVLLPEKIATISSQYNLLQHLSDKARQNKAAIIVGLNNRDNEKYYNSAYLFSQDGQLLLKYDKQHLVPAYEGRYTPGNTLGIIETQSMGKWGIAICKDMDFVQPSLEYSKQGINIMFVPALDFHDDGWTHGRVAIMRGVEGNYAVARSGQWGLLTLSDSTGRIVGMESVDTSEDGTLLMGELKLGEGKSIYSKFGNWFGWTCVVLFVLLNINLAGMNTKIQK